MHTATMISPQSTKAIDTSHEVSHKTCIEKMSTLIEQHGIEKIEKEIEEEYQKRFPDKDWVKNGAPVFARKITGYNKEELNLFGKKIILQIIKTKKLISFLEGLIHNENGIQEPVKAFEDDYSSKDRNVENISQKKKYIAGLQWAFVRIKNGTYGKTGDLKNPFNHPKRQWLCPHSTKTVEEKTNSEQRKRRY